MSGSPKYSQAQLDRQRQEQLERQRQQQAAAEAKRRKEAEERQRQQQITNQRQQIHQQAQTVLTNIQKQQGNLYAQDAKDLQQNCQRQINQIQSANTPPQFQTISTALEQIESGLFDAVSRKRRDDAEKQRQAEIERQQFELEELSRQLTQIPPADGLKFDESGQIQVNQALQSVHQALSTGNPALVRQPLQQAIATVQQHQNQVHQQRAVWQHRKAQAEENQNMLHTLIAGLQADPVVVRWQTEAIAHLQTSLTQAEQAIAHEQFEHVMTLLTESQNKSEEAIAAATAAQLQSDQRDYITNSIAQTLEEMGFTIVYRQPEDHGNPASATILGAATNSGKGISVSIPTEGEVFYDVDGYAKSTAATVGGGATAVCDEAEQVLTEMHVVLADKFGVKMSELQWEGKDPNRQLRKADQLPSNRPYYHQQR